MFISFNLFFLLFFGEGGVGGCSNKMHIYLQFDILCGCVLQLIFVSLHDTYFLNFFNKLVTINYDFKCKIDLFEWGLT